MSFTQSQVDNLVSVMQQDMQALLTLSKRMSEDVEWYNSIGGSTVVAANPPSGANLGITSAQVVTAIANMTTLNTSIATFRDSFTVILSALPR